MNDKSGLVRAWSLSMDARRVGAEVHRWHRPLTTFAALMAVWGLVSFAGLVLDDRHLDGARIWAKPLKFTISLGLYALTLAWMISVIKGARFYRAAWWAGNVGVGAAAIEILLITVQVVRGTTSHFNVSTPFNQALYFGMAFGVVAVYSATLVIGALLLFGSRVQDRSLLWALRLGLLIGLAGLSVGFLMVMPTAQQLADPHPTVIGSHSVGGDDASGGLFFVGWNLAHGDLRISHFVGMHALQVLPLLAVGINLFLGSRLSESTRLRVVVLAAAAYAAVTVIALWQALRGQSVVSPDLMTLAVSGAAAVAVLLIAAFLARRVRADLRLTSSAPAARLPLLSESPSQQVLTNTGERER